MGKLLQNFRRIALVAAFCCSAVFGQTEAAPKNILFLGDSLTAGLGVAPQQAFPALIGEKIHAARLPFQVINAGVSGDTTSGGLRRVDWLMQQNTDVLVLELGANDGLRGLGVPAMKANLQAIMARVKAKNPAAKIVLAGMQLPPNLGADYAAKFQAAFVELAKENNAALIPFLLEGVGGHADLNQPDQIHPNAAGHRIVAETVWRVLAPILAEAK